jgi:hypothetical protein
LWCRKSCVWVQLSNSGDTLKLVVLSCNWKVISGSGNDRCIVTTHKVYESKVGYRGSKSIVLIIKNTIVKEQRVDGSRCFNTRHIRYTLMGFERNYQIKIPSKQIISKRLYSSSCLPFEEKKDERSLNNKYSLNPWFFFFLIKNQKKNFYRWGRILYGDSKKSS